jgi:phospholipid/cholesterol/gamma-HCH transport system ATP-binding protein
MSLIALQHLHKRFGRQVVLNDLSLTIETGKCLVILGVSGSGKSVLLKHIVGLLKPDRGEVWYDNRRIDQLSERLLAELRRQFGFLFQMGALFDSLTVEENVGFPLVEHTNKSAGEIHEIVQRKLAMVGLPELGQRMPAELSGGQRKRVALARAIAMDPRVILYDEPTTGLDPIRSDVINELILKLQNELKATSIVVTHDLASAFKVADRLVMLHEGKIIFDGTAEQIRRSENPVVKQFVSGEADEQELQKLEQARRH